MWSFTYNLFLRIRCRLALADLPGLLVGEVAEPPASLVYGYPKRPLMLSKVRGSIVGEMVHFTLA